MPAWKAIKNQILNLLYPPKCMFCGQLLPPDTELNTCPDCAHQLPYCLAYDRCAKCGKPVEAGRELCSFCRQNSGAYVRISSVFLYSGKIRQAILRFKKETGRQYARPFAAYMAAVVQNDFGTVIPDWVVSVPPRKGKSREPDAYDQAAHLADTLAKDLHLPRLSGALKQLEVRAKQSGLGYGERFENMRNNVAVVKPRQVVGKTILLVDDVCTSRATLQTCAAALRQAGAANIYCVTLATVENME